MIPATPRATPPYGRYALLALLFATALTYQLRVTADRWGEERLIETVTPARTLPLSALMTAIMSAADAHTGTAPQHDDMTLVVARCI